LNLLLDYCGIALRHCVQRFLHID
jgi:hypothetical protein